MSSSSQQHDGVHSSTTASSTSDETAKLTQSNHTHENNINSSNTNPLLQSLQPLQKSKPQSSTPSSGSEEPTGRTSPLSPTVNANDTPAAAATSSNNTNQSSSTSSSTVTPSTSTTSTSPSSLPTPAESLTRLLTNSVVEVMEALETLLIYTKNLLLYPDEKKYRKIKMTNIHYQERLGM